MRESKLAIILALLVVVGGTQAQAKLIRDSPWSVLKLARDKLVRLNAAHNVATRDVHDARMAYQRLRIIEPITLDREENEGWKRAIQKAKDAWNDRLETANKLKAEIETQEKVVAKAEAALK